MCFFLLLSCFLLLPQASSALTNLLKSEFCLLEHFRDARLLLLMEAGDVVHHFVTELFPKVR